MKKFHRSNQRRQGYNRQGFTIIEVTLVTAFIAMLLIAIATILASMISVYQKGMILKAINSTGRNLISELTNSINAAPSIDTTSLCHSLLNDSSVDTCTADNAFKYIFQDIEGYSTDDVTGQSGVVQYGGVLCTGEYSYIWNTKYGKELGRTIKVRYSDGSTHETDEFKIARFRDRTYRACSANVSSGYVENLSNTRLVDVTQYANGGNNKITDFTTDFLEETNDNAEANLSLYELTIFPVSQDSVTLRAFFSGTFILGTERGDATIVRSGDYCDVTNLNSNGEGSSSLQDLGSEFNYCGINKFNFAARTAGSGI